MIRLKSKGWGPWKQKFYSVCSSHCIPIDTCHRCNTGMWMNVRLNKVSQYFERHWYSLWFICVNRSRHTLWTIAKNYFTK